MVDFGMFCLDSRVQQVVEISCELQNPDSQQPLFYSVKRMNGFFLCNIQNVGIHSVGMRLRGNVRRSERIQYYVGSTARRYGVVHHLSTNGSSRNTKGKKLLMAFLRRRNADTYTRLLYTLAALSWRRNSFTSSA